MPVPLPPPGMVVEAPQDSGPALSLQDAQSQFQIPRTEVYVEVVGNLPIADKVQTVTRLLGLRRDSDKSNRRYPPTILELIMLVNRNPARPRGRQWDSIQALTIRYHPEPGHVIVEYCIDHCDFDRRTGAFDPRRTMVVYRAERAVVEERLDKKLRELQKYERR